MPEEKPTIPLPGVDPTPAPGSSGAGEEELALGARAGAWEVERLLARGGHGQVYVASHLDTRRRAALKVLSRRVAQSPEMSSRFVREVRVLGRLQHPNVVEILELGILPDGRAFCAMELLEGKSLLELIGSRGRFSIAETIEILAPVCSALEAAHGAGVVHRDVKASNVFVSAGDPPVVKLLDFGVARAPEPGEADLTVTGERLGSAHAMAPELIRGGTVDGRADVYALGVLLYQLLTGTLPFWSEDPFELERLHLAAPAPRPGRVAPVPPSVDAVVERALAKRPEDRIPTAAAFLEALRTAAGQARPGERAARAAAVHISVVPAPGLAEDAAIALAAAEADAERVLAEAGFQADVRAAGALLATRVLPEAGDAADAERARAVTLGRDLLARLAAAAGPDARVQVCVHVGEVKLGPGDRRSGGEVFRTTSWVRATESGFFATVQALDERP
jgi:serine/threonine-protein kinase